MKQQQQIYEAAQKFHEALKAMPGVLTPCVIYSYSWEEEKDEDLIEAGFHGRANDVLATCDRVNHNILNDAYTGMVDTTKNS